MAWHKIKRLIGTAIVAALIFVAEIVFLVPWVNVATSAYVHRDGALQTPELVWGVPVVIALVSIVVFLIVAVVGARGIVSWLTTGKHWDPEE